MGVVSALGAAIGFAVFQTVQRRALRGIGVYRATAAVLIVAASVLWSVAAVTTGLPRPAALGSGAIVASAAAGLLHFGLGWTLLAASQVRLGAARTGVVVGTVPLFGAIVAAIALDEPLGPVHLLGLAASVVGVVIVVSRAEGAMARTSRGAVSLASDGRDAEGRRLGLLAGLGAALCWSVSPVLVRRGIADLGSPLVAAAYGMAVCAATYAIGLLAVALATGRRWRGSAAVGLRTARLLGISGTAVGLAILLQWTALDLARVALVLAVLQLTPPFVVALAVRVAGEDPDESSRQRVWVGTAVTVTGSLALVLAG